jgi:hypothetical protein
MASSGDLYLLSDNEKGLLRLSEIAPPTIKVSLQNMPFRFFFLGGLLDFRDMQTATTTMTVSNEAVGCST